MARRERGEGGREGGTKSPTPCVALLEVYGVVVGQDLRRSPRLEDDRERPSKLLAPHCRLHATNDAALDMSPTENNNDKNKNTKHNNNNKNKSINVNETDMNETRREIQQ